jgi:glycosyltransferase involved in cell wall biosynthesis
MNGKADSVMLLIPALNEAENLRDLLPRLPRQFASRSIGALIVDDGSEDATREVALTHGFAVVSNLVTRGGGAAIRLGYDVLRAGGCEICITMDADGQHRPQDIPALLAPILEDRFDFVIGSRLLGSREKDSRLRLTGVYFFGWVISMLLGKKITDPSSGFRAFRLNMLDSINLREDQYHTSELIIEAVKNNVRVGEVPITILKRKHGKSKKGRDWKYALHFTRVVVRTWWR